MIENCVLELSWLNSPLPALEPEKITILVVFKPWNEKMIYFYS